MACSNFPGSNLLLAPNDAAGIGLGLASLWGSHTGHGCGAGDWRSSPTTCLLRSQSQDPVTGWPPCMEWCCAPGQQAGLAMVLGAILARGRDVCKAEWTAHPVCALCAVGCLLGFFLRTGASHPRSNTWGITWVPVSDGWVGLGIWGPRSHSHGSRVA